MRWAVPWVLLAVAAGNAADADSAKIHAAKQAAGSWLALVDKGGYQQSWEEAASFFKNQLTAAQWEDTVKKARGPLGPLESRKLVSAAYATQLPGAPDGEYVVIQYKAVYENKTSATETVTPLLDKDGAWRVSGYFIK